MESRVIFLASVVFAAAFAANVPAYQPGVETPVYRGTSAPYNKAKYPSREPEYPKESAVQPPAYYESPENSAPANSDYPVKDSYSTTPAYRNEYVPAPVYPKQEQAYKPRPQVVAAAAYSKPTYQEEPVYAPPEPYSFGFTVKDEYDEYSRQESSDGKVVSGSYHVQLPDGRKQIVTYTADAQGGYNAEVKYEGEAKYPEAPRKSDYKQQQQYKPAAPVYKDTAYKPATEQEYSTLEK